MCFNSSTWFDYNTPFFFDLFYLVFIRFVLTSYAGVMFGATIGCNLNVYKLCEKIPINSEYLLGEGEPTLRRRCGSLIITATVIAFILSALINVPILLFSGELRLFLNLALAIALTIVIFLFPHYMFHRMLEKAKNEILSQILSLQKNLGFRGLEDLG